MRLSEILSRLNGVSTPIGGVSWTPPQSDVEVARRVLVFLEDRRVLFVPSEVEILRHCVESVLRIREFLTEELTAGGTAAGLAGYLQAMRAGCRKFVSVVDADAVEREQSYSHLLGWSGWIFNQALGEMRGVFGIHVAQLAGSYGLQVPETLVPILPLPDDAR